MDTMGHQIALIAAILVAITFIEWFRRAFATRIPTERGGFILAMSTGVVLGVASILMSSSSPAGAWFAVLAGGTFLLLNRFSAMDDKKIALQVGGPIIEFSARDENGDTFNLADVIGRPFLLKFFRGHW
jgi:hypothetical protein